MPIENAQSRLAEMRAAGLSPGHGGEAAKKRGMILAENNRKRVTGRGSRVQREEHQGHHEPSPQ